MPTMVIFHSMFLFHSDSLMAINLQQLSLRQTNASQRRGESQGECEWQTANNEWHIREPERLIPLSLVKIVPTLLEHAC